MKTTFSLLVFTATICASQAFLLGCGCLKSLPPPISSPCSCVSEAVVPAPQVLPAPLPVAPPVIPTPAPYVPVPCGPVVGPQPIVVPLPKAAPLPCVAPAPLPPKVIIATPIAAVPVSALKNLGISASELGLYTGPAALPVGPAPLPVGPAPLPVGPAPLPAGLQPASAAEMGLPPPPASLFTSGSLDLAPLKPLDLKALDFKLLGLKALGLGAEKCTVCAKVFDEEALFRGPPCKCNCHDTDLIHDTDGSGDVYFKKPEQPKIPADPVSLAIALRAAQRSNIQEGQLTFGFKKKPIDQLPRAKKFRNIPEEKLFDIHSKVIEFKKPRDSEEDEFKIDESDEEFTVGTRKESNIDTNGGLFYSDIGYSESLANGAKFINVPISTTPNPFNVPLVESEYTGRIISIPEENTYLEQLLAEYISHQCQPKDVMT